MDMEVLRKRLGFIIYGNNIWRLLSFGQTETGEPSITIDAHGQTVREARRMILNIINITRHPMQLDVIHGFNHGTAIRDMLAKESFGGRLEERFSPVYNPGETIMRIAA